MGVEIVLEETLSMPDPALVLSEPESMPDNTSIVRASSLLHPR
jgi:hypothetical protein